MSAGASARPTTRSSYLTDAERGSAELTEPPCSAPSSTDELGPRSELDRQIYRLRFRRSDYSASGRHQSAELVTSLSLEKYRSCYMRRVLRELLVIRLDFYLLARRIPG